jgi:hypothetical protein
MEEYIREIRKQGDTVGERLLVLFKMFQFREPVLTSCMQN